MPTTMQKCLHGHRNGISLIDLKICFSVWKMAAANSEEQMNSINSFKVHIILEIERKNCR
ncbi:unnamed protein product [Brugia timori]|uniref:Uncharacterized protein n=1 Tax=Brugia timori TaxID=42155 RepID=A0A0R3QV50_9BILA|nr:unnamed protein product [Brugia timori]